MTIEERKNLEERKGQFIKQKELPQVLMLENRKKLKLTGVSDVESFSDSVIVADTGLGKLTVRGEGLKISKLNVDDGELAVEGKINILEYPKKKEKSGFFESIFR